MSDQAAEESTSHVPPTADVKMPDAPPEPAAPAAPEAPAAAAASDPPGPPGPPGPHTSDEEREKMRELMITTLLVGCSSRTGARAIEIIQTTTDYEQKYFANTTTNAQYTEKMIAKIELGKQKMEALAAKKKRKEEKSTTSTSTASTASKVAPPKPTPPPPPTPPTPHPVIKPKKLVAAPGTAAPAGVTLPGDHAEHFCNVTYNNSDAGHKTWVKSMLVNPTNPRAFSRPPRKLSEMETNSKALLIPQLLFAPNSKHPYVLLHLGGEGLLVGGTLVACTIPLSNEKQSQCFDYEGDNAMERACATIAGFETVTCSHMARLHPLVGPILWTAKNTFPNLDMSYSGVPNNDEFTAAKTSTKKPMRFMVVTLMPPPPEIVEDFAELASKDPNLHNETLHSTTMERVTQHGSLFNIKRSMGAELLPEPGREKLYALMSAIVRLSNSIAKQKLQIGALIIDKLTVTMDDLKRKSSAADGDESDDEQEVEKPSNKPSKKPARAGQVSKVPTQTKDVEPASDNSSSDDNDDDDDMDAENRVITNKQRGVVNGAQPSEHRSDDEEEDSDDEGDDKNSNNNDSEEEEDELDSEEESNSDNDDDDDDEEDMAEVSADDLSDENIGDDDEVVKKKPVNKKRILGSAKGGSFGISSSQKSQKTLNTHNAAPPSKKTASVASIAPKPGKRVHFGELTSSSSSSSSSTLLASKPSSSIKEWAAAPAVAPPLAAPRPPAALRQVSNAASASAFAGSSSKKASTSSAESRPESVSFTDEQLNFVYTSDVGARDDGGATGKRKRHAQYYDKMRKTSVKLFGIGNVKVPFNPTLNQFDGLCPSLERDSTSTYNSLTALALFGTVEKYDKVVTALLKQNEGLSDALHNTVSMLEATGVSGENGDASATYRAMEATAMNILSFTPKMAALGKVLSQATGHLSTVAGQFSEIVADMNNDASIVTAGLHEAYAASLARKKQKTK